MTPTGDLEQQEENVKLSGAPSSEHASPCVFFPWSSHIVLPRTNLGVSRQFRPKRPPQVSPMIRTSQSFFFIKQHLSNNCCCPLVLDVTSSAERCDACSIRVHLVSFFSDRDDARGLFSGSIRRPRSLQSCVLEVNPVTTSNTQRTERQENPQARAPHLKSAPLRRVRVQIPCQTGQVCLSSSRSVVAQRRQRQRGQVLLAPRQQRVEEIKHHQVCST